MKTHITFDFLRGLLVACIARDAGQLLLYFLPINFPWSVVPPAQRGWFVLAIVLTIAVYSPVLLAVLLRPASTTQIVLGILLVIAVVLIGFLASAFLGVSPKQPSVSLLLVPGILFGPPLTAVIAFFCMLKSKSNQVA